MTLADEIRSLADEIFQIVTEAIEADATDDDAAAIVGELLGMSADRVADSVALIASYIESGCELVAMALAEALAGESFAGLHIR